MTKKIGKRSFAPNAARYEQLKKIPAEHLAEAVDVAFIEFMTAIFECSAAIGIDPKVTLGWLITQMIDSNYHWAHDLGKHGYINFKNNPHVGRSFADLVKAQGQRK